MSGYVFHCTPCGISHAGECPPRQKVVEKPWEITIDVGSRWRGQIKDADGNWQLSGFSYGYEVVSLVTTGDIKTTVIQIVQWGSKLGPVFNLDPHYWFEDGIVGSDGAHYRMVPYV